MRLGLSDYVQQRNGDAAFLHLKPIGTQLSSGDEFAELETIKATLSLISPLAGELIEINKDLDLKWEHFVSKLQPGQKETWTAVIAKSAAAKVNDYGAEKWAAELVAIVAILLIGLLWTRIRFGLDLPPGTGDAQLTLAQNVPLKGAIIISTPQDLSLIDARRGLAMFRKVNVPVLGIVENMSYFQCPHCGTRSDIFGHGGARQEAERLAVPFLGEIPLHMSIRATSDSGTPVVESEPESGCPSRTCRAALSSSFHLATFQVTWIFRLSKAFCQYSFHCLSMAAEPVAYSMVSGWPLGSVRQPSAPFL